MAADGTAERDADHVGDGEAGQDERYREAAAPFFDDLGRDDDSRAEIGAVNERDGGACCEQSYEIGGEGAGDIADGEDGDVGEKQPAAREASGEGARSGPPMATPRA